MHLLQLPNYFCCSFPQSLYSFRWLSTQKLTELSSSRHTKLICLLKGNVFSKIPWSLIVTHVFSLFFPFLALFPARSFATLMLTIMHNSVPLIISIMLNLIGSFQFQDHIMLCKNRKLLAQRLAFN